MFRRKYRNDPSFWQVSLGVLAAIGIATVLAVAVAVFATAVGGLILWGLDSLGWDPVNCSGYWDCIGLEELLGL